MMSKLNALTRKKLISQKRQWSTNWSRSVYTYMLNYFALELFDAEQFCGFKLYKMGDRYLESMLCKWPLLTKIGNFNDLFYRNKPVRRTSTPCPSAADDIKAVMLLGTCKEINIRDKRTTVVIQQVFATASKRIRAQTEVGWIWL